MKLLLLIESMSLESGGPTTEVVQLTETLMQETDAQITIASITPSHQRVPLHPNVSYFQFDNPIFPQWSWFRAINDLKQLIRDHDLIIVSGIWGPIDGFALRLAWQQEKPVYIRVCGMLEPYILARNPIKKWLARWLYLYHNLQNASGLIVQSNSEGSNVQKVGSTLDKILVIPNGMEVKNVVAHQHHAKRSLGVDPQRPVLLYLSRLHPKKGLHVLLQAMALLPAYKRTFTLVVAGDYSDKKYQQQINDLIDNGNLQSMVHFSGIVSGKDKERHFQAADGFILPSQSEGLPVAVLEALSYGLPVIITKGCNIPEVATYGAGVVIDLSVANLTRALDWFITGGDKLKEASTSARQLVKERFNPEQSIHQFKQILSYHSPIYFRHNIKQDSSIIENSWTIDSK